MIGARNIMPPISQPKMLIPAIFVGDPIVVKVSTQ